VLEFNQKIYFVTGRPPVFQVRHCDDYSNDLEKHAPLPEITHEEASDLNLANNNILSSDREYDEDDTYYSPTRSVQWSNSGSVIKRSSPMQVYACKVNYFRICMCW
jgi:hypothetical protein